MREFIKNLSICFAAGGVAGLCYALGLWALGHYGITRALSVDIAPHLSNAYLYQRVVWGGICGLIFMLPWRKSWITRGFLLSLIPAGILLLVLLPMRGLGVGALALGTLTPLVIILACAAGGIAGSGWLRAQGK
ncbi:hypothetical protein [Microbulbifer agarilyticus]|uniref:Uncharacterized protein n=1 Tax=Microbulbifer agarilyticus TaxID=260552 RepID=A0A1Q2M0R3_9GAMM|nr:hypothetical protein [Microbulbifer agarilyticus]AQQ66236.1 hypothetical protein Mag101_00145 [Microbulbifer agarilyticus]